MIKIAKTVSKCDDCPFFLIVEKLPTTSRTFAICDYIPEESGEYQQAPEVAFIINAGYDARHYSYDIPPNCPLETYNPT